MSIIIQKYGGTSVGSVERIRNAAELVIAEQQKGNQVIAVVSAMAGMTNTLVEYSDAFATQCEDVARDFVISSGENISCGLLALALKSLGVDSIPLAGWQVPIVTTHIHGRAEVQSINVEYLKQLLAKGVVPVITGFQGVSENDQITTLGRGGSDTSAVAIAAAISADRCDIYTDIDGVYTADPRLVAEAGLIPKMSFDFALDMARRGTQVIHPRAVEYAKKDSVALRVLSSFGSKESTQIGPETILGLSAVSHLEDVWVTEIQEAISQSVREAFRGREEVRIIAHQEKTLLCVDGRGMQKQAEETLRRHRVVVDWQQGAKVSVVLGMDAGVKEKLVQLLDSSDLPLLHWWEEEGVISIFVLPESLKVCANYIHQQLRDKKY